MSHSTKRLDNLTWDEYFMGVAFLSSKRSKDPNTQVGACLVNDDLKIVGIGYNGMPIGCDDDDMPWSRNSPSGNPLETKYPFVCHAEMNAIMNKSAANLTNCTIYVALFPCNECAKLIIQSGIREVVYTSHKSFQKWVYQSSLMMLEMAGVKIRQFIPRDDTVLIDFKVLEKNCDAKKLPDELDDLTL